MRAALLAAALLLGAPPVSAAAAPDALVWRTEHGIPHIVADDDTGIGYGYGYVVAQDQICPLAESYVTVAGERSRYFGPDGRFDFYPNNSHHSNLSSDLFYRQLNESGLIDSLVRSAPPLGPKPGVRALVRGYVKGYNRRLADVGGANGVSDPACRGEPWVKPITRAQAYGRFAQIASLAGGSLAITGIAGAQPPGGGGGAAVGSGDIDELGRRLGQALGRSGSNAIALGRDKTSSGAGMVLGNPHLTWRGDGLLYQAHLTIPGEMDVAGATYAGVPLVVIGHTRRLAWSHTTSSAFRFTPFELRLASGEPTTYLVDGQAKKMTSRRVTVPVTNADGSTGEVSRTLWSTEYGPVFNELLGLPLFPWTATSAYAFADANERNLRYLNHFYDADRAQSVPELETILRRHQGIPWANTLAADSAGRALYADASVVPHVTDAKAASCNTPLGSGAFFQLRLPVLDGARSACAWGSDPDAVHPGIFGPGNLPFLHRSDYVENSNDSHWLSNPEQPLEGFARIIGDERTERSPRTRLGLRMIREQGRFSLADLQELMLNDRNGGAELMRDELVGLCRATPAVPADACDALAGWDGRDRAESRGALLFRRFAERFVDFPVPGPNAVGGGAPPAGTWADAFDPARPVDTPEQLNTANPKASLALSDAVNDLRGAGIPLDAPLGDWQYEQRGGERIPWHGGPGEVGVFNAYMNAWDPQRGYPDVVHGASFLMATELRGACPPTRTLVGYSQSSDSSSPWHVDQTRMLARREWVEERYCESQVLSSPALRAARLGCLPGRAGRGARRIAFLRPRMTAKRALRVIGAGKRARRRARRWCVRGGGAVTAFFRRGRVKIVATSAPAHSLSGARPRRRLRASGWRRVGYGLRTRRVSRGLIAVAELRRGRVRRVALAPPASVRTPAGLRRLLHPQPGPRSTG